MIDVYLDGLEVFGFSDFFRVISVVLFFVSRVDFFIDKMFEKIGIFEVFDFCGKVI